MPAHAQGPEPPLPVLALGPAVDRDDVPGLCQRLLALLEDSDAAVVLCDAGAVADPDMVTVEALARLQLTARRHGRRLRLHRANRRLRELLALAGLQDVLPLRGALRLDMWRQPEQREQPLGVKERVEPDDPAG